VAVSGALDTALPLGDADFYLFDKVDEILKEAEETSNPQLIFNFGIALRKMSQTSGLGLAKLLHDGEVWWNKNVVSDDDWPTVAMASMGISDQTYNKYTRVWRHVICHPYLRKDPTLQQEMMKKPIRGLILLTAAARENQLEPSHWETLAKAPNIQEMRSVVAEVRGYIGPAKTAIHRQVRKDGSIWMRIGKGPYEQMGYIRRDHETLSDPSISQLEGIGYQVEPI
jgi:hypothetical protein